MKEKILITGSEGFIGSHLVETLIKKNYNIRAFVQYNSFSSILVLLDSSNNLLRTSSISSKFKL